MSDIMVAALKSQVVGLQLARDQANQVVNALMASRLTEEQRNQLFHLVLRHCQELDASRASQLEVVLRTAVMQLNTVAQSTADTKVRPQLVEIIKALTLTVECASLDTKTKKENNERS